MYYSIPRESALVYTVLRRDPWLVQRCLHHDHYGDALLEVALEERLSVLETPWAVLALAETLHALAADLEDYADELRRQDDFGPYTLESNEPDAPLAYHRALATHVRSVGLAY